MTLLIPDTPFMRAVLALLARVDAMLTSERVVKIPVFIVGGAAVHAYTGWRVSNDLDVVWGRRVLVPGQPAITYIDGDEPRRLVLDRNFSDVIGLFHPDWTEAVLPLEPLAGLAPAVISPVDLAVSKIGRWLGHDPGDVAALARQGLLSAEAVKDRTQEAMDYFVGNVDRLTYNLRDALEVIETCSPNRSSTGGPSQGC